MKPINKNHSDSPAALLAQKIVDMYESPGAFIRDIAFVVSYVYEYLDGEEKGETDYGWQCILLLANIGETWTDAKKGKEVEKLEQTLSVYLLEGDFSDLLGIVMKSIGEQVIGYKLDPSFAQDHMRTISLFHALYEAEQELDSIRSGIPNTVIV